MTAKRFALIAILLAAAPAAADYDVRVDLKNVSGEAKTDWPVVLRVYTVLGRDLPVGSVDPEGFHVYDPSGKEVRFCVVRVPPLDRPGNDELVFMVDRIDAGQTLSYRVTNTAEKTNRRPVPIDLVAGPHNLIAAKGFESGAGGFAGGAVADDHARAGKASLKLTADGKTVSAKYKTKVPLHKGSRYYFGAWSRTEGVARFGYQARGGAYALLTARDPEGKKDVPAFRGPGITPQCSTRDWMKMTFGGNRNADGAVTEWGMDRHTAGAVADHAELTFELRQRKHYYMAEGKTAGAWWLDDVVLMEQPEVRVRFDLAVKALMKDGVFLFTRPATTYLGRLVDEGRKGTPWCGYPYAHEKLTRLERVACRGRHVVFCVGLYHTREVAGVTVRPADGALAGPGGAKLPVDVIEYMPGFAGEPRGRYLKVVGSASGVEPVALAGARGVRYFFLTFRVPRDAKPGRYEGTVEVRFGQKLFRAVPIALRVQDLVAPDVDDAFVGMILQGGRPPFNDESLKVYARSDFNCITRFGGFLGYEKTDASASQVDLARLDKSMTWLKGHGLTGVCVFSDFDLGPKWDGGALLKRVRGPAWKKAKGWSARLKTAEDAWKAQIGRIEAARKGHPAWPELIYMTWDEPGGGRNGRPDPAMGWVNQVAPKAITTLDVQFAPLRVCAQWYNTPAFDDPANWAGPEVYDWCRRQQGGHFGFCGSAREEGDSCRYQVGMMILATGARYFHAWHLGRPQHMARNMAHDRQAKRVVRSVGMINYGEGMNDLKACKLLQAAMADAVTAGKAGPDLAAARAFLKKTFALYNGDHKPTWPNEPYLGTTNDWGCEGFYDHWREHALRHAAKLKGVKWID